MPESPERQSAERYKVVEVNKAGVPIAETDSPICLLDAANLARRFRTSFSGDFLIYDENGEVVDETKCG